MSLLLGIGVWVQPEKGFDRQRALPIAVDVRSRHALRIELLSEPQRFADTGREQDRRLLIGVESSPFGEHAAEDMLRPNGPHLAVDLDLARLLLPNDHLRVRLVGPEVIRPHKGPAPAKFARDAGDDQLVIEAVQVQRGLRVVPPRRTRGGIPVADEQRFQLLTNDTGFFVDIEKAIRPRSHLEAIVLKLKPPPGLLNPRIASPRLLGSRPRGKSQAIRLQAILAACRGTGVALKSRKTSCCRNFTHGRLWATMSSPRPDVTQPFCFEFLGPIQRAFEDRVIQSPDATALTSRQETCTYRQLDEIANRLANALGSREIRPGDSVMLYANRSPALIYAMLATLKSGATFFVADSAYPSARLLDCMALAKPTMILVCGDLVLPRELRSGIPHMHVPAGKDAVRDAFADQHASRPNGTIAAEQIAYFNFTSGSTGKPKGIRTAHAPLVHFIGWHVREHGLNASHRFSFLSGLAHDPSLRDIFTPLSIGASLHVPDQETLFDPFRLARWIRDERIDVLHLTPALGQILASGAEETGPLPRVRHFFFGGDVLSPKLTQQIRRIAPFSRQINFYGATETPQAMSSFEVDAANRDSYPIGKGIADVQLLIVTERTSSRRSAKSARSWIRTPYLSAGYLGQQEQTQERFVANPFTRDPADRCYKTGDLGRYLPDGNVVFAGRLDHQVKIRGFRVELDEVVAKLEEQPGVVRAIVLASELGRESSVLVAYYTCDVKRPQRADDLRHALQSLLPDYMVPVYQYLVPFIEQVSFDAERQDRSRGRCRRQ